jgi:hypothetical protein
MRKIEEIFIAIWCVVMPVTGTVLIPEVQGTIPAYLMAFGSVAFVLLRLRTGDVSLPVFQYLRAFAWILLLWLFLFAASQLGLIFSDRHDFSGVNLISEDDPKIVFRTSLFTQSVYFLACVLIALYFRYFFRDVWMRYVFWGGYFLAIYGIYEWLYFLIFHHEGDFLVNRTFGVEQHLASWSQGVNFGGISLLRIKSTLGEPTFFAGVVLPFLFLALDYRKFLLAALLIFCALFSTSTACYIGLISCLLIKAFWSGRVKFVYLAFFMVVVGFLISVAVFFPDTFDGIFGQKLAGDSDSGKERIEGMGAIHNLLESFTVPNWLFGLGFGYTYLGVFIGVLVNTGLVGLGVFVWIWFRPVLFLPIKPEFEGLKMGLLAIAICFLLSLSEFFLPTSWMFLGLAHRKLAQYRAGRISPPRDLSAWAAPATGSRWD